MADKINECVVTKDDQGVPLQYDVAYEVENGDASRTNNFCVTILASDMVDPTDTDEVTTLANAEALEIKTAWIATLTPVKTMENVAIDGDVTL